MAEKQARRRFTAEFKAEAVKRLLEGGKGLGEVAAELGIGPGQLGGWRNEHLATGSAEALAARKGEQAELQHLARPIRQGVPRGRHVRRRRPVRREEFELALRRPEPVRKALHGGPRGGARAMLPPRPASPRSAATAVRPGRRARRPAPAPPAPRGRPPRPASRPGSRASGRRRRRPGCTALGHRSASRSPRGREPTVRPTGARHTPPSPRRPLRYRGSWGVGFYNRQRLHSALGYRTPAEARAGMEGVAMRAAA